MNKEEERISELIDQINNSWQNGDFESLKDVFHEDVVFVHPQFAARTIGRSDCINSYVDFLKKAKILEFEMHKKELDIIGDTAIANCDFSMRYKIGGVDYAEKGTDVLVLSKEAGKYKLVWRTMLHLREN